LVFFLAVAVIAGAMSSWAINDLNNVARFRSAGSELYAADGATQVAIRASRYTYPTCAVNGTTPCAGSKCPGTATPLSINNYIIQDWCATTLNVQGLRQVALTACLLQSSTDNLSGLDVNGNCLINGTTQPALLTAVVDFNDNPPPANPADLNCTSTSQSTCGLGDMTIISWVSQ
jgi:hypothetical protein